jgi:hypothetical protein
MLILLDPPQDCELAAAARTAGCPRTTSTPAVTTGSRAAASSSGVCGGRSSRAADGSRSRCTRAARTSGATGTAGPAAATAAAEASNESASRCAGIAAYAADCSGSIRHGRIASVARLRVSVSLSTARRNANRVV